MLCTRLWLTCGSIVLGVGTYGIIRVDATPEATVSSLIAAFNRKDFKDLVSHTVGGTSTAFFDLMAKQPEWPVMSIDHIKATVNGDDATGTADITIRQMGKDSTVHDSYSLKRVSGDWKVVPKDPSIEKNAVIGLLAYFAAHPQESDKAKSASMATVCLSNVKQLVLACLLYQQDNDDKLSFKPGHAQEALNPYTRNKGLWTCPDDKGHVSYSVNEALLGKKLSSLKVPGNTVEIYEGAKGKLTFRHNGRATVGFADGHVRLVTADQAKQLAWKPS